MQCWILILVVNNIAIATENKVKEIFCIKRCSSGVFDIGVRKIC